MRIPSGAPVPFWFNLLNRFKFTKYFRKPPLGSTAVIGTVLLTFLSIAAVTVYPKSNADSYRKLQKENWQLLNMNREDVAQGMRPWSDPFDRK
ncbi:unnamed protein product [Dracunculus medinensis]|uniref:COX6C domain-containing protein n=1 Tax=Dracunculus medinensis TaxID=318479 RepID=A0A0N4UMP4_DRAME|nr:unnamed protein product [Dracunculus medinensis]